MFCVFTTSLLFSTQLSLTPFFLTYPLQVRRSRRIQELKSNINEEVVSLPSVPLGSLNSSSSYQQWVARLVNRPISSTRRWMRLPITNTTDIPISLPQYNTQLARVTARQRHNTIIYYLTSSYHSSLPTYYLHDPTDPSPPTVFFSTNPKWVERKAITYARSRIQVRSSAVVGVYVECANSTYMIAMFHLNSYLFLPLPYRIPLSITATLYSSIQLDNSLSRVSRLLPICIGNSLIDRHSELAVDIGDTLSRCTGDTSFYEDFDNDERHYHLDRLSNYATLLIGLIRNSE